MGEFSYDSSGKLISAVKVNERMDMTYDHHGRRISLSYKGPDKTTDILTPDEMISIEDNIMYILIFDGNQCVARVREDDGPTVYLHHNHLGSTSKVAAADGSILQSVYYDPFGAIIENTVAVGTNEVRILFSGNEYDFFTGLLYMSSRYYCPKIDNPEVFFAKVAKNLGESQNIGSALSTVAKELGKSMINTSSGYPILNLIFGEIAAPICQTLIDSSASGIIVLDYGDDILDLLKEAGVEIKKEFKF